MSIYTHVHTLWFGALLYFPEGQ